MGKLSDEASWSVRLGAPVASPAGTLADGAFVSTLGVSEPVGVGVGSVVGAPVDA